MLNTMIRKQMLSQSRLLFQTQRHQLHLLPSMRQFCAQNQIHGASETFDFMQLHHFNLAAVRNDRCGVQMRGEEMGEWVEEEEGELPDHAVPLHLRGRNSRAPKKANHGARPCSSVMRKMKKKGWYHKIKDK